VDALALDGDGRLRWAKVPNTEADPRAAIAAAIARVAPQSAATTILLHSTTLATNALLEGKLPVVGLIVTRGFREILSVGGSGGAEADFQPDRPCRSGLPIVPLELVHEVDERMAGDGSVSGGLDEETVRRAARWYRARGIATVAVSFLHSYANPAHELRVKQILSEEIVGVQVLLSYEISRRAAEYERTATTSANAALKSLMAAYLTSFCDKYYPSRWVGERPALAGRCSPDGYAGRRGLDQRARSAGETARYCAFRSERCRSRSGLVWQPGWSWRSGNAGYGRHFGGHQSYQNATNSVQEWFARLQAIRSSARRSMFARLRPAVDRWPAGVQPVACA